MKLQSPELNIHLVVKVSSNGFVVSGKISSVLMYYVHGQLNVAELMVQKYTSRTIITLVISFYFI